MSMNENRVFSAVTVSHETGVSAVKVDWPN